MRMILLPILDYANLLIISMLICETVYGENTWPKVLVNPKGIIFQKRSMGKIIEDLGVLSLIILIGWSTVCRRMPLIAFVVFFSSVMF